MEKEETSILDRIIAEQELMVQKLLASASSFIGIRSLTTQINDLVLGGKIEAWVSVTEDNGGLIFNIWAPSGNGDLRAFYANVAPDLAGKLTVSGKYTSAAQGSDSVTSLGNDTTMSGTKTSFDLGVEIGTQGVGKDKYTAFSFRIDSAERKLSLADVAGKAMGLRVTSVEGVEGGTSSKLVETTMDKVFDAANAVISLTDEGVQAGVTGDLLADAKAKLAGTATLKIDTWEMNGATYKAGETAIFDETTGTAITVNADGTYTMTGKNSWSLSKGEVIGANILYSATATELKDATSYITDRAIATILMKGTDRAAVADAVKGDAAEGEAFAVNLNKYVTNDRYDTNTFSLRDVKFKLSAADGTELDAALIDTSGLLALDEKTGEFRLNADSKAASALADGMVLTVEGAYEVTDQFGSAAASNIFSLRLKGIDSAVTTEKDVIVPLNEGDAVQVDPRHYSHDADLFSKVETTVIGVRYKFVTADGQVYEGEKLPGDVSGFITINKDGTVSANSANMDWLGKGSTLTARIDYIAESGGTKAEGSFDIAVAGENDAVFVKDALAAAAEGKVIEDRISAYDPDFGDKAELVMVRTLKRADYVKLEYTNRGDSPIQFPDASDPSPIAPGETRTMAFSSKFKEAIWYDPDGRTGSIALPEAEMVMTEAKVGETVEIADSLYATFNADGSYKVDAANMRWLSEGQIFQHNVEVLYRDSFGAETWGKVAIELTGQNDRDGIKDASFFNMEGETVKGNLLEMADLVDLKDTVSVYSIAGQKVIWGGAARINTLEAFATLKHALINGFDDDLDMNVMGSYSSKAIVAALGDTIASAKELIVYMKGFEIFGKLSKDSYYILDRTVAEIDTAAGGGSAAIDTARAISILVKAAGFTNPEFLNYIEKITPEIVKMSGGTVANEQALLKYFGEFVDGYNLNDKTMGILKETAVKLDAEAGGGGSADSQVFELADGGHVTLFKSGEFIFDAGKSDDHLAEGAMGNTGFSVELVDQGGIVTKAGTVSIATMGVYSRPIFKEAFAGKIAEGERLEGFAAPKAIDDGAEILLERVSVSREQLGQWVDWEGVNKLEAEKNELVAVRDRKIAELLAYQEKTGKDMSAQIAEVEKAYSGKIGSMEKAIISLTTASFAADESIVFSNGLVVTFDRYGHHIFDATKMVELAQGDIFTPGFVLAFNDGRSEIVGKLTADLLGKNDLATLEGLDIKAAEGEIFSGQVVARDPDKGDSAALTAIRVDLAALNAEAMIKDRYELLRELSDNYIKQAAELSASMYRAEEEARKAQEAFYDYKKKAEAEINYFNSAISKIIEQRAVNSQSVVTWQADLKTAEERYSSEIANLKEYYEEAAAKGDEAGMKQIQEKMDAVTAEFKAFTEKANAEIWHLNEMIAVSYKEQAEFEESLDRINASLAKEQAGVDSLWESVRTYKGALENLEAEYSASVRAAEEDIAALKTDIYALTKELKELIQITDERHAYDSKVFSEILEKSVMNAEMAQESFDVWYKGYDAMTAEIIGSIAKISELISGYTEKLEVYYKESAALKETFKAEYGQLKQLYQEAYDKGDYLTADAIREKMAVVEKTFAERSEKLAAEYQPLLDLYAGAQEELTALQYKQVKLENELVGQKQMLADAWDKVDAVNAEMAAAEAKYIETIAGYKEAIEKAGIIELHAGKVMFASGLIAAFDMFGNYTTDGTRLDYLSLNELLREKLDLVFEDTFGGKVVGTANLEAAGSNDAPFAGNSAAEVRQGDVFYGKIKSYDIDHLDTVRISNIATVDLASSEKEAIWADELVAYEREAYEFSKEEMYLSESSLIERAADGGRPSHTPLIVTFSTRREGADSVALDERGKIILTINDQGIYDLNAADALYLGRDEIFETRLALTATDNWGAEATGYLDVKVYGADDLTKVSNMAAEVSEAGTFGGKLEWADVDANDIITLAAIDGRVYGGAVESVRMRGDYYDTESALKESTAPTETVGGIQLASGAILTVNPDGSFVYNTNGTFNYLHAGERVTDTFTYQVKNQHGDMSDTATVSFDIIGEASKPLANNDYYNIGVGNSDSVVGSTVLKNDSVVDWGDTLELTAVNGKSVADWLATSGIVSGSAQQHEEARKLYNIDGSSSTTTTLTKDNVEKYMMENLSTATIESLNAFVRAYEGDLGGISKTKVMDLYLASAYAALVTEAEIIVLREVAAVFDAPAQETTPPDAFVFSMDSGAKVFMKPSGGFEYHTYDVWGKLAEGEYAEDIFNYTVMDKENGLTADARAVFRIFGVNDFANAVADKFDLVNGKVVNSIAGLMANDFDIDNGDIISFAGAAGKAFTMADLALLEDKVELVQVKADPYWMQHLDLLKDAADILATSSTEMARMALKELYDAINRLEIDGAAAGDGEVPDLGGSYSIPFKTLDGFDTVDPTAYKALYEAISSFRFVDYYTHEVKVPGVLIIDNFDGFGSSLTFDRKGNFEFVAGVTADGLAVDHASFSYDIVDSYGARVSGLVDLVAATAEGTEWTHERELNDLVSEYRQYQDAAVEQELTELTKELIEQA